MRRIAIDALSARGGGGWTYLVNLVRELERDTRGFRFTLLVHTDQLERLGATRHVEVVPLRLPSVIARVAYEELLLPVWVRGFELLYAPADISPLFATVPTVVAMRNLNIYDRRYYDTARLRWLERLAKLGARRVAKVVFPSRAAADWISSHLGIPPDRVEVVYHGVSRELFDEARDEPEPGRYAFLPAAIERHKCILTAVRSIRSWLDPELELWIAGGTTDPAYRELVAREIESSGLEHRIRLLGPVDYRRMPGLYRQAQAMILCSELETFGHPVLEAMLTGCPPVVSDLPVFREIAGDSGWYFCPGEPEALAGALNQLIERPDERARRVAVGRERVEHFTWKRSVDDLCSVFDRVLKEAAS